MASLGFLSLAAQTLKCGGPVPQSTGARRGPGQGVPEPARISGHAGLDDVRAGRMSLQCSAAGLRRLKRRFAEHWKSRLNLPVTAQAIVANLLGNTTTWASCSGKGERPARRKLLSAKPWQSAIGLDVRGRTGTVLCQSELRSGQASARDWPHPGSRGTLPLCVGRHARNGWLTSLTFQACTAQLAVVEVGLGQLLAQEGRVAEAEQLYRHALDMMEAVAAKGPSV